MRGRGGLLPLLSGVVALPLVFALACTSSDASSHDDVVPSADADGGADAAPRPLRPLATVWGAPMLVDENPDPNIVEVHLEAGRARATFDGKEIDVFAFNGSVPGPILQARPHQRVIVHFKNALDEPTTVHWHGLRIPAEMDGSPRIQTPVPPGGTFTYDFVLPDAGSFWYHPHVNTHDQLERGLYGPIVVQGDLDPEYDLERSIILDDVSLDATTGEIKPPNLGGFDGLTGRWGNVFLTNGKNAKLATATAKKGQVERWRLVNSANARLMPLHIEGVRVRLIGTDGGLLSTPIDAPTKEQLVLPVGGRLELEVSYDAPGTAKIVIDDGDAKVTMLSVNVEDSAASPRVIAWPAILPAIAERPSRADFQMTFDFIQQGGTANWYVNGESHWMEPIITVNQGATVKLRLSNATAGGVAHPFHMHGQFFRVVDNPAWPGLRDTVMVPDHGPIEIITYFDNPGVWMAHCHILEHAELGMMTEIEVLKTGAPIPSASSSSAHQH